VFEKIKIIILFSLKRERERERERERGGDHSNIRYVEMNAHVALWLERRCRFDDPCDAGSNPTVGHVPCEIYQVNFYLSTHMVLPIYSHISG
jgi:hypothetical protein